MIYGHQNKMNNYITGVGKIFPTRDRQRNVSEKRQPYRPVSIVQILLSSVGDPDHESGKRNSPESREFPPYPANPLIKQYSAEYWLLGDLMAPPEMRAGSFAKRVCDAEEADVVFVPFFATLSAEMQLGKDKVKFRKKEGNEDYKRQRAVVDFVRNSEAWKRSGGRDHVFVLTDPAAMWHVRKEIAPAILLVVDFGGWFKLDSKSQGEISSDMIRHTRVSLLKDVIVPYTYLLPKLHLSENQRCKTLLDFKGAKHRPKWLLRSNNPREEETTGVDPTSLSLYLTIVSFVDS